MEPIDQLIDAIQGFAHELNLGQHMAMLVDPARAQRVRRVAPETPLLNPFDDLWIDDLRHWFPASLSGTVGLSKMLA